ncbi:uncharacterized protein [Spinacia oleracea]|uniref:Enkurin domain-containing protein n=1 Tax=Spinacia oleracea TaxID=3562 RepID=A0ABM3QK50_SPIOL|nr:uncharacterized protein LOC130460104 [Spinacia oleracea]
MPLIFYVLRPTLLPQSVATIPHSSSSSSLRVKSHDHPSVSSVSVYPIKMFRRPLLLCRDSGIKTSPIRKMNETYTIMALDAEIREIKSRLLGEVQKLKQLTPFLYYSPFRCGCGSKGVRVQISFLLSSKDDSFGRE